MKGNTATFSDKNNYNSSKDNMYNSGDRKETTDNFLSLADYGDFSVLHNAYERHRSLLIDNTLQLFLPSFYNIVTHHDEVNVA